MLLSGKNSQYANSMSAYLHDVVRHAGICQLKRELFFAIAAFLFAVPASAQQVSDLIEATKDPKIRVQAIHHYPKKVKDGECHYVEIVSVTASGSDITIVEQWSNWLGNKATTTLTGKINNGVATGTWKSTYSSGSWSYDFSTNSGTWNKTGSMFDRFEGREKLEFKTGSAIKDGFYKCEHH